MSLLILPCAFLLDLLLGDPRWLPHPVVLMGKCISGSEKVLRRLFPKTPAGELAAGLVLALALPCGVFAGAAGILWAAGRVSPWLSFALSVFWSFQCLAARDLKKESMAVYRELKGKDLASARRAVGRIVGRDTDALTHEGVIRAAVETVAENFSDGVAAPMLFLLFGGAPLGLAYKAVNTMDSMVGYRNDRYLYFGRAAARLDDAVNFLPARLSAFLMVTAAFLTRLDGKNAFYIWRRDRQNHKSPNSAQTEAACAGALRVRLAGDAWYFGKLVPKPYIGDDLRPVEAEDIPRANRLMMASSWLCLGLCLLAGVGARLLAALI